jgi:glycosyltransferase involved in cell wall biosynthesis
MKIAIVGTLFGSICQFRLPLIKQLINEGHTIYVFAIDFSTEDKIFLKKIGAITIDYKLSRSGLNILNDLKTIIELKNHFKEIKPDIVFSFFVKPVIYGTIAARLANIKKRIGMLEGLGYAFTIQPNGITFKTWFIKNIQIILYSISLPFTTNLIFLNKDDFTDLILKNNIKIRNSFILGGIGVDLNTIPYCKPQINTIRFLFIGRLLKEKGINEFISAILIVKKKYPLTEFIVLGGTDNTSPNSLNLNVLKELVNNKILIYPGVVNDVLYWLNQSSVFVLPSYREGVPRSSQEALAVGRAILTTDVPGCRETVIDGKNGFLIPPFDFDKLAEKMIWFIENPDYIISMGIESRKIAEDNYDINKINNKLIEILC